MPGLYNRKFFQVMAVANQVLLPLVTNFHCAIISKVYLPGAKSEKVTPGNNQND